MDGFLHDFGDGQGLVLSHYHKNGGGIVASTATVSEDSIVEPNAQVGGFAMVINECKVLEQSKVFGNAYLYNKVTLEGTVEVSGTAELKNELVLFGSAKVSVPPKIVLGFDHPVIITDSHIFLGCHCFNTEQWKKAKPIIKVNGYPTKTTKHIHKIISDIAGLHFNLFSKEPDEIYNS